MADYKTYLASSILTEDMIVTYRLLSRALKVNVNAAKEMLYEFHRQQNGKKPGTIHATYLISGTKLEEPAEELTERDGEDTHMRSSPFPSSSMPQLEQVAEESGVLSITLVREENLEEIQSKYEHISSIHVYSIGPHPLKDLQVLSDITREVQQLCATEDSLEAASTYGTIINKNVRRREGRRPPAPTPAPAPAKVQPPKPKPAETKPEPPPKKEISSTAKDFFGKSNKKSSKTAAAAPASNPSNKETTPNPPALKRDSSIIFKSFAKAKPKLQREGTESSVASVETPALSVEEADSPMKDVSDDDEVFEEPVEPVDMELVNKSRKERKEKLRQMMELDDEEDEAVAEVEKPEIVEAKKEREPSVEKEVPPVVSGGRRRGRRRVMKKKTVKDEEGYLVTKEEAVWESFSEDEPAPLPKAKAHAPVAPTKGKKAASKAGQGSIMSFFGKK